MGRYGPAENGQSVLFDLANIKYLISLKRDQIAVPDPSGQVSYKYRSDKFEKVFEDKSVAILENKKAFDRALFVSNWEVLEGEENILKKLISPEFDLKNKIILSDNFDKFETYSKLPEYEIKSLENKSDREFYKLTSNQDGFLFVSETFYPGWKVYVDGKEERIYRANYTFRAVPIKRGIHEVLFIYRPQSFKIGKLVSFGAFISIIVIYIWTRKK